MKGFDDITEAELVALEHRKGDGEKMFRDTGWYRLTTTSENPDADVQRKPGTLRGDAADFIRKAGDKVRGRTLHYHMLTSAPDRKWDYGYVHAVSSEGLPKRGSTRDWLRRSADSAQAD